MKSTFPLSVPQGLYDATCEEIGQPMADALLFGASLRDNTLLFRTQAGYHSAQSDARFVAMAGALKMTLLKPDPWPGKGDRPSAKEARAQMDYQR